MLSTIQIQIARLKAAEPGGQELEDAKSRKSNEKSRYQLVNLEIGGQGWNPHRVSTESGMTKDIRLEASGSFEIKMDKVVAPNRAFLSAFYRQDN